MGWNHQLVYLYLPRNIGRLYLFAGLCVSRWANEQWQLSLLNDEQMNNKIGVEHQPDRLEIIRTNPDKGLAPVERDLKNTFNWRDIWQINWWRVSFAKIMIWYDIMFSKYPMIWESHVICSTQWCRCRTQKYIQWSIVVYLTLCRVLLDQMLKYMFQSLFGKEGLEWFPHLFVVVYALKHGRYLCSNYWVPPRSFPLQWNHFTLPALS